MKKRLVLSFMFAAVTAVLLLSARLFLLTVIVQYHLSAIADDRDVAQHIDSLVRLGRLSRPTLFRTLELQRRQGRQAMIHPETGAGKRCAACAIVLAKAYENKELSANQFRDFVRAISAVQIRGMERHIVPCLLPISFESPAYVLETCDAKPRFELSFDATLIIDETLEIQSRYGHRIPVHGIAAQSTKHSLGTTTSLLAEWVTVLQSVLGRSPEFYIDFTKIEFGRHTMQARFVMRNVLRNHGTATDVIDIRDEVLETEKFEFWVVEPREVPVP